MSCSDESARPRPAAPLVTIGLPVYNGARHLEEAVRSLLAQTEPELLLHISDNCSTDGTPRICQRLAGEDPRVRYTRLPENVGALRNFELVLQAAESEFFMWAAHDDLWHPAYIEECLRQLSMHPDALACATATEIRDVEAGGSRIVDIPRGLSSPDPVARAKAVRESGWNALYGLFRRDRIGPCISQEPIFGSDIAFVFGQALTGRFVSSPRVLTSRRLIGYRLVGASDGSLVWEKALEEGGNLYSENPTQMCRLMARFVTRSNLATGQKVQLYWHILWTWWFRDSRSLILRNSPGRLSKARAERDWLTFLRLGILHAILRPRRVLTAAGRLLRSN
jgi:glycosyltransferase involved in cell wall biosynthesis